MADDWRLLGVSGDALRELLEMEKQARNLADMSSPYWNAARQLAEQQAILDSKVFLRDYLVPDRETQNLIDAYSASQSAAKQYAEQERLRALDQIRLQTEPYRYMSQANAELERLAKQQLAMTDVGKLAAYLGDPRLLDASVRSLSVENSLAMVFASCSDTVRMAHLSSAAQALIFRLPDHGIAAMLSLEERARLNIEQSFGAFTKSYSQLTASYTPESLLSIPSIITNSPPVEVLFNARLVLATTVNSDDAQSDDDAELLASGIAEAQSPTVDSLLSELDRDLWIMLAGARDAARSTNPDRSRHVLTSIRELLGHVLRRMAPDDRVATWSSDPKHFPEGRPTRHARLQYIASSVNHGPLSEFLEADFRAIIKFFEACNAGTHGVSPKFTDAQLRAIVARTDGLLLFLLQLWNNSSERKS